MPIGDFIGETDAASDTPLRRAHDGVVRGVAIARDLPLVHSVSGLAVSSDGAQNQIRVWNLETREELHRILDRPRSCRRVEVARDGLRILVITTDGVEFWDLSGLDVNRGR